VAGAARVDDGVPPRWPAVAAGAVVSCADLKDLGKPAACGPIGRSRRFQRATSRRRMLVE